MYKSASTLLLNVIQWKLLIEAGIAVLYHYIGLKVNLIKPIAMIANLGLFYYFVVGKLGGKDNKEILASNDLVDPLYKAQGLLFACLSCIIFFNTIDYHAMYKTGDWKYEQLTYTVVKFTALYLCILYYHIFVTKQTSQYAKIKEEYGDDIIYSQRLELYASPRVVVAPSGTEFRD